MDAEQGDAGYAPDGQGAAPQGAPDQGQPPQQPPQPQQPQQPQQQWQSPQSGWQPGQQAQQPAVQKPKKQPPDFSFVASTKMLVFLIVIGIFLVGLGAMAQNMASVQGDDPTNPNDPGTTVDNNDREARGVAQEASKLVYTLGKVLWNLGIMLLMMGLFVGGIFNAELDQKVRMVMLIVAMFILVGPFNSVVGFDKFYDPTFP